jgi:hypothetical protein
MLTENESQVEPKVLGSLILSTQLKVLVIFSGSQTIGEVKHLTQNDSGPILTLILASFFIPVCNLSAISPSSTA